MFLCRWKYKVLFYCGVLAGCWLIPEWVAAQESQWGRIAVSQELLALQGEIAAAEESSEASESHFFDGTRPWEGFATGLRQGFERFPRPIGSPLYFEDPFINSDVRPILLYHEFPESSLLGGGDLTVLAVQARVAITDRLQLVAFADGHSDLEADALPQGEGYNDLGAGLKYALHVDPENLEIVSVGLGWRLSNGSREIFHGIEDEINVYVSGARAFGNLHVIANVTGRITTHHSQGNDSLSWNVHGSYLLGNGFYPLLEYHGFLYLSNGNRLAVRDGLLDYGNLGASDVRGSSAHWATAGFRHQFTEHVSWGVGYGFALRPTSDNDIFDRRFTANLVFTF